MIYTELISMVMSVFASNIFFLYVNIDINNDWLCISDVLELPVNTEWKP